MSGRFRWMHSILLISGVFILAGTASAQNGAQVAKLVAGDGQFGSSVAVSGDVAVVGAPFYGTTGSAYVFVREGGAWIEQAQLLADDAAAVKRFGVKVAVSGDVAVIGTGSSWAYVFERNGDRWIQTTRLPLYSASGGSVAISGDVILTSSDSDSPPLNTGSARVYVRDGTTWIEQARLFGEIHDEFGRSAAISGDVIAIGAPADESDLVPASVYIFARDGAAWTQQARLFANDNLPDDAFAVYVAVSGDTVVAGAFLDDDRGHNSGSAYVFVRDGTTWTQQAKLRADDGAINDLFGGSVGISGDVAVIGACCDDDLGSASGSAYVFVRNGATWTQQAKLLADDGEADDLLGHSVAVFGDVALIGAVGDDDRADKSGAVYAFLTEDDADGDGVGDSQDSFPGDATEWLDTDGDGIGNNTDPDDDNDGFGDTEDVFPRDPTEWLDSDGDGTGDNADPFPNDPTEWRDTDGDGVGDNADVFPDDPSEKTDSDGDGVGDNADAFPNDPSETADTDGDGIGDNADAFPDDPTETTDSDGDGVGDNTDVFPFDPNETIDTDLDGCGDNGDAFPNDPTECLDTDGDGVGDNTDTDDDNDGIPDDQDAYPAGQFADVDPRKFAFLFIETLGRTGIYSDTNFFPGWRVRRAEIAQFIELAMNGSDFVPPPATGNIFLDVGANIFRAPFIEQLFNDGITGGCGNNNFCPFDYVTRAQAAVLLLRAKHGSAYLPPPPVGLFLDVDLSYWAVAWIDQLAVEGITMGCGDGNYCPEDPLTRAQMAVFLVRTFSL